MSSNDQTTAGTDQKAGNISLEAFAKLTGFPVELIREEIFPGGEKDEVSLEELRAAMLSYIDSSMLTDQCKN